MRYEQIELAVVVVIEPDGTRGKSRTADSCFCRDVGELSTSEISKQVATTYSSHVNVIAAIVVEVSHRAAHAVHLYIQTRTVGCVRERPVAIIVVQRSRRSADLMLGPVHGLNEKHILPAIVIVVKHADAAPHRLRQVLLSERAIVVTKVNARRFRDVSKSNGTGWSGWRDLRRSLICGWQALFRLLMRRFACGTERTGSAATQQQCKQRHAIDTQLSG